MAASKLLQRQPARMLPSREASSLRVRGTREKSGTKRIFLAGPALIQGRDKFWKGWKPAWRHPGFPIVCIYKKKNMDVMYRESFPDFVGPR